MATTHDITITGQAEIEMELDYDDIYCNIEHSIEYLVERMIDDAETSVDIPDEADSLLRDYIRNPNPCSLGDQFEQAVHKACQRNGMTPEVDWEEIRKFVKAEVRAAMSAVMSEATRLLTAE